MSNFSLRCQRCNMMFFCLNWPQPSLSRVHHWFIFCNLFLIIVWFELLQLHLLHRAVGSEHNEYVAYCSHFRWVIDITKCFCLLARDAVVPPVKGADVSHTKQHLSNVIVMKTQTPQTSNLYFCIILYQYVVLVYVTPNDRRISFIMICHGKINTKVNWVSEGCVSSLTIDGFPCTALIGSGARQCSSSSDKPRWLYTTLQLWPHAVNATHLSSKQRYTSTASGEL